MPGYSIIIIIIIINSKWAVIRWLYLPGTHGTGGWVGPRAGLDVYEKSRPDRDSIPGLSRGKYTFTKYTECVRYIEKNNVYGMCAVHREV
jgi:hypothetical protein